ncbi:MAG: hypothetical protein WDO24_04715 [Pseudomonadota bacterium]
MSAGTGSGTTGDVQVTATDGFNLLGTAGALTFGGDAGVGVGADAGVVNRRTQAYVGANAKVTADGNVVVLATSTETIDSFSIAGVGGGSVAVGLTAGVSVMNLTTTAYIDSNAVVAARNNVLVSAEDQTTVTLVSGNVTGGGSVAVGVGAGISVLNKDTESYIAADAQVSALALGSGITANTGSFGTASGTNTQAAAANVEFVTSAVSGNTITATNHGLQTGDEVIYSGARDPLSGLENGGQYYVIAVDANHFELASSLANAQAGLAITLGAGHAASGDDHTVERLSSIGVPSLSSPNFSDSTLANNREGAPLTASRKGVAVVAVSTNDLQTAGFAGGASGSVAVQVAGTVDVHNITTIAHIDAGAKINQSNSGANANQSVAVDAAGPITTCRSGSARASRARSA